MSKGVTSSTVAYFICIVSFGFLSTYTSNDFFGFDGLNKNCFFVLVLWFYGFMVLWFYGFMVLWFYGFMFLWFLFIFLVLCFIIRYNNILFYVKISV